MDRSAIEEAVEALRIAVQLAYVASDWNLDEIEIDGEMVSIYELHELLLKAYTRLEASD